MRNAQGAGSSNDSIMRSFFLAAFVLCATAALAQDNYEIQVYGSETIPKGDTMVESHTNFTPRGDRLGTRPTNHAVHETLEVTHGWNDWFETGFYLFNYAHSGFGFEFVGTHIRPRVRVPAKWNWPVGVSLSTEIGYVRPIFSADTWTWELRPIVDKTLGRWYLSFNPTLERTLVGPGVTKGFEFAPNAKVSYDITKRVAFGLEYYGAVGDITHFDPAAEQEHQFFPAVDLDLGPRWEFNAGVGIGVTRSTDRLLLKVILGHRFGKHD